MSALTFVLLILLIKWNQLFLKFFTCWELDFPGLMSIADNGLIQTISAKAFN